MGPYIRHRYVLDQSKLWSWTVPSASWKPRCFTLLATNNLTHRRIYAQPFGLVHIFITSLATEHRLRPPSRQCYHLSPCYANLSKMSSGITVNPKTSSNSQLACRPASVETDTQHVLFHFTHWISCCLLPSPWEHPLFIGLNNTSGSNDNLIKWEIRGHLNCRSQDNPSSLN